MLLDKTATGQDAVWTTSDGVVHEFFQFNDRGRGPKTYTNYRLDDKGLIRAEDTKGIDYMKTPVTEVFSISNGQAVWKNQAEDQKQAAASGKYFVDLNGGPENQAILARALLRSESGKLQLLPGGEASIRKDQSLIVQANGHSVTATLYAINGLGFSPTYVWLDQNRQFFASVLDGFAGAIIREGFESTVPTFRDAQVKVENGRAATLAKTLAHKITSDLIIRDTTVFDSQTGKLIPHQRVTVRGQRILSMVADRGQPTPQNAQAVDGSRKTLLPGLWDMHQHLFAELAFLDIATGITTARDMGNSIESLSKLRGEIDAGRQIGPRVVPAGFIDGPGPYEGPIKVLAATPEEAKQRVNRYADLGYAQIKIYSSVKPELVPVIVEEAHKRGLRVSGHIPSGMIAEQFVRAGADEIQHINFIFLNFMPDVKETRTPARFIEPGKRGGSLDLNSPQVNGFVAFLREHHTVVDPTLMTFEDMYVDRAGQVALGDKDMFDRLPVQVQRASKTAGGALSASDPTVDKQYRAAFANMVRMVKKMYDGGVQIVAGTDAGSGYALDRELELYAQAGIPATEILRIATLKAAQVMHKDGEFGSVTPGKYADLVLVNGDPTRDISDIRKIELVITNGDVYRPAELQQAFGIRPQ
ncbi:MAG TPA: amidohydrolase family protein [Bryobacteraceae bacterium]|nr:amidohydrolase family protein [Bryobacteraceae bacterium]